MKLTDKQIEKMEAIGFNRWTKGKYDRLYIDAEDLGLEVRYYNSGNIADAKFHGESISNAEARRMRAAKVFVDIETGTLHSDREDLREEAEKIMEAALVEEVEEAVEIKEENAKASAMLEESIERTISEKRYSDIGDEGRKYIAESVKNLRCVFSGIRWEKEDKIFIRDGWRYIDCMVERYIGICVRNFLVRNDFFDPDPKDPFIDVIRTMTALGKVMGPEIPKSIREERDREEFERRAKSMYVLGSMQADLMSTKKYDSEVFC